MGEPDYGLQRRPSYPRPSWVPSVKRRASSFKRQASSVEHQVSSVPTSSVKHSNVGVEGQCSAA